MFEWRWAVTITVKLSVWTRAEGDWGPTWNRSKSWPPQPSGDPSDLRVGEPDDGWSLFQSIEWFGGVGRRAGNGKESVADHLKDQRGSAAVAIWPPAPPRGSLHNQWADYLHSTLLSWSIKLKLVRLTQDSPAPVPLYFLGSCFTVWPPDGAWIDDAQANSLNYVEA